MSYLLFKYIHIVCAAASFALFFIRGIWAIRAYPSVQEPWARALPHVIDGLLVFSALAMFSVSFPTAWGGTWMIELPSVFRLPTHRHYAANFFSC